MYLGLPNNNVISKILIILYKFVCGMRDKIENF